MAGCFDGKSVMDVRNGDLEYLPAWRLLQQLVDAMIYPSWLDASIPAHSAIALDDGCCRVL